MDGLATSSDGSFGYDYIGQFRAYESFMDIATGGGNDGVIPGLHSDYGFGVAVKGPAVDMLHGFVYWMSCERMKIFGICSEWALKRATGPLLRRETRLLRCPSRLWKPPRS